MWESGILGLACSGERHTRPDLNLQGLWRMRQKSKIVTSYSQGSLAVSLSVKEGNDKVENDTKYAAI
jgi:hypothetical protein